MTVRLAKFGDIPRLTELCVEMYGRSIYQDICAIDEKAAKAMFMRAIQRQGGKHEGSTLVPVAERDDVVEGFMVAVLTRIFGIGDALAASDTHFYVSSRAHARDAFLMIDAFEEWALPVAVELDLCAIDGVGEYQRTEKLYKRKGYVPYGAILTKRVNGVKNV